MEASEFYRALIAVDDAGHAFARMPFGTSDAEMRQMRQLVIDAMDRAIAAAPPDPAVAPAPAAETLPARA
jgi:hypothetical protein